MTSREIFLNIMRRQPTPRLGIHENFWTDGLNSWLDQGYPTSDLPDAHLLVDMLRGDARIPASPIDYFNIDDWKLTNWLDQYPLKGHKEILSEDAETIVYKNGAGATLRDFKSRTGVPEHMDYSISSREIWERDYKPHLRPDADRINWPKVRAQYKHARETNKCLFYCFEFIWETMRRCIGDMNMYMGLMDDPEWMLDMNRCYTDFYITQLKRVFDEVGLPDGGWIFEDIAYSTGLFCSPTLLADLFFPFYKELADFFHSYNLPVVFHSCGKVEAAIPMIIDAGYDALNPLEYKAGTHALEIAKKYGSQIALIGGMDARIFESNDLDAIEKEIRRLTIGMKEIGAHYIFGSDHSISPNVKFKTYRHAVDVFYQHASF